MKNKIISIDAEYRGSKEKNLDVVSFSIKDEMTGEVYSKFVWKDLAAKQVVYNKLKRYKENGYIFLTFYASAEVRSLLAIGFTQQEILEIKWLDLYVFWAMLNHNVEGCKWGRMSHKVGNKYTIIETTKPVVEGEPTYGDFFLDKDGSEKMCEDVSHKKYGLSLVDCVYNLLGVDLNSSNKDAMRDLILTSDFFNLGDIDKILTYNELDIEYLYPAFKKAIFKIRKLTGYSMTKLNMFELSLFSAVSGIVEGNGLPVDFEKLNNLSSHYIDIRDKTIEDCNLIYPFYEPVLDRHSTQTGWRLSSHKVQSFIGDLGITNWDRTPSGMYKTTDKVLESYKYIPAIQALYSTKWILKQINRFNNIDFKKRDFLGRKITPFQEYTSNIGSDGRLRYLQSPFKSTTGRSQPKPSEGNIFGWSSWFRVLIQPKDTNYVVIGADYSSQEIAVSAVLSKDQNFIDSYNSSDPYFWLAQRSNFIDPTYQKIKGKYYDKDMVLLSESEQRKCSVTRSLFKSLTLGIGFGLGIEKLTNSLNSVLLDTLSGSDKKMYENYKKGIDVQLWLDRYDKIKFVPGSSPIDQKYPLNRRAKTLIDLHKNTYKKYWSFRDSVTDRFKNHNYYILKDGWSIINSISKTKNSIANFPVQGTAAVILRKSLINCIESGLEVIATVHDAIYIVSHIQDIEKNKKLLIDSMTKGATDVLGVNIIRIDVDVYTTDWDNQTSTWVKNEDLDIFKEYLKYFLGEIKKEGIKLWD